MRLHGKRGLIRRPARGIGFEFARAYIAEGAIVTLAGINRPTLGAAVVQLGPHSRAQVIDVTDQTAIDAGFAAAIADTGGLDSLITKAALLDAGPVVDITRVSYDKLFAVNVAGHLFCLQAAARHKKAQGGGKILNMASHAGRRGEGVVAVCCATKAAVISLSQFDGLDLIQHGINVNALPPAWWRARVGTRLTRFVRSMEIALWARKNASSGPPSPSVGRPQRRIWRAWRYSLPHPKQSISSYNPAG